MLEIKLIGHLTLNKLNEALAPVGPKLEEAPHALIVDCTAMNSYDREARELFVRWNRQHRSRILRVAIATDKILWHTVISAMALASSQEMKAFNTVEAARRWAAASQTAASM